MRTSPGPAGPLAVQGAAAHATICGDAARLLCRMLARMPWSLLRYSDRQRLDRALSRLENNVSLARTVLNPGADSAGQNTPTAVLR